MAEVNGYEVEVSTDYGSMQPCYHGPQHTAEYPMWEVVRTYSTDIAAAEPLLDAMLATGEHIEMGMVGDEFELTRWQSVDNHLYDIRDAVHVPTLADKPLAITRAWLVWTYRKEQTP
jgi:hypothetical protein